MKDNSKFVKKQDRLNAALEKVKNHLQYLLDKYDHRRGEPRTETENEEVDTWNDWHDLQERIERRLIDNYQEAQNWHFQTFGWAVIKQ